MRWPKNAGLLRRALGIDEDRQVAADSPIASMLLEEEGAMAAEQVLDVVLRGRDQHVDAGLVHPMVEAGGVERRLRLPGAWWCRA